MKQNLLMLIQYTKEFIVFSGYKTIILIFCSIITGVTRGIGIFMLIPFINVLGINGIMHDNSKLNYISKLFIEIFRYCGIPLTLLSVLVLFLLLISVSKTIQYKQNILSTAMRNSFVSSIQTRLFKAVIFAEWQYIANQRSSNLTHVITTDLPYISNGTYSLLKIITNFSISIVYILWAMFISIELTLFIILFGGLSFLFLKFYLPHSHKAGVFVRNARSSIYSLLLDHVHGLKVAKSYGAEQREYDKFRDIAGQIAETQTDSIKLNSKIRLIYVLITNVLLCVFLYVSISLLNVPLVSLFLLIVIFSKLLPNISSFQTDFQRLFSMLPSFSASDELYKQAEKHQEKLLLDTGSDISHLNKTIELNDLEFSYSTEQDSFKIEKLNITIPAGSTTVIAGESGSGKSTFADLLTGILKPTAGEIKVDGIPTKNNLLSWRKQIGYLPQEIFLFHDTLRNNILWGKPDASDSEIYEALKLASAFEFVMKLPKKLDTVVKDKGQRLSGGERQRIALARTLIRKPSLLLLDEATSSLDKENETKIYESIANLHGKMTIIFITHKTETLKFADNIINISDYA
ncbi:MAG: ABC transporter ATP-binding protein [bacterium]|nr:ABC transporter ATP-binding protein [bacterium]